MQLELITEAPDVLTARAGALETLALGSDADGFVSNATRNHAPRQTRVEVCQHCGLLRPVKGWAFFEYTEDQLRLGFAPLCEPCNQIECARIEQRRRERRR